MKEYNIYPYHNDLVISDIINSNGIKMIDTNMDNYKILFFDNLNNRMKIKEYLINIIDWFFYVMNIDRDKHIFVVGIGNDNYTSDSVGPKTLKHIRVNSYLTNMGLKMITPKVSALEPGVLGETGILTERIISSVVNEIKPDIVIMIDSYVTDTIDFLNKTIEINNNGLYPGNGIKNINSKLDREKLGVPVLVIGVPTAVEVKFTKNKDNYVPYLLSTKDVDKYIDEISKLIGEAINASIDNLK